MAVTARTIGDVHGVVRPVPDAATAEKAFATFNKHYVWTVFADMVVRWELCPGEVYPMRSAMTAQALHEMVGIGAIRQLAVGQAVKLIGPLV